MSAQGTAPPWGGSLMQTQPCKGGTTSSLPPLTIEKNAADCIHQLTSIEALRRL